MLLNPISDDLVRQRKIYEVIQDFDFIKVHNVMVATDHKWSIPFIQVFSDDFNEARVPSIGELVFSVIGKVDLAVGEYLKTKDSDSVRISSGGFEVTVYDEGGEDISNPYYINLRYFVTESEA